MKLEICANSFQSAINAQNAGAHRIELCVELSVGGITPSYGLIKNVMEDIQIPVFVLIRPRSGNFTYSSAEFEIMKQNIQLSKDLGCHGIVSGVLHSNNTIDVERTKELIELSRPLKFTFHRAFDWLEDPLQGIQQLIDMKVDRVLTSGQQLCAEKGLKTLIKLKAVANQKITILPGGGINASNATLFERNGFSEIHTSASSTKRVNDAPKISMNSKRLFNETSIAISDERNIKNILNSIQNED